MAKTVFFRKLTNAKACDISLRYQTRSLGQATLFHEETVLREAKPVKLVLDKFWNCLSHLMAVFPYLDSVIELQFSIMIWWVSQKLHF